MLFFLPALVRADSGFDISCQKLAGDAAIQVVFEDRQVSRDDRRSLSTLKRLSPSEKKPYHNVLGLTHAVPMASLDVTPLLATDAAGRTCGVPTLTLKLGFSALEVYLASELRDSCRRRVVEAHEQEHVAVWRSHLRAGARMMQTLLRNKLARPAYFQSPAEADKVLRRQVEDLVAQLLNDLRGSIEANQRQIDSLASYQQAEGQMRACP